MISYDALEVLIHYRVEQGMAGADRERMVSEARRAQAVGRGGWWAAVTAGFTHLRTRRAQPAALPATKCAV